MSPLRFRKVLRLGPLAWHFTRRGLSSWSIRLGAWSWTSGRRKRAQGGAR